MLQRLGVVVLCMGLLGACSDGDDSSTAPSPDASGCSSDSAAATRGVDISGREFTTTCVTLKVRKQLLISNTTSGKQKVTTEAGAPQPYTVDLPNKGSSFAFAPTKKGRYVFNCTRCTNTLTVFVT